MDGTASSSGLPRATIRTTPEDFVVEEIPAYSPNGRGEHLYITFRKIGRTTNDAVRSLAIALDADPRGSSYAGMKDRHAVTTQTASFPFPLARDVDRALEACRALPDIEILSAARHENKLRPGHLLGNRFRITLRNIEASAIEGVAERLALVGRTGVPNAFGPQRFGRDGDNPARTIAWLSGKERGPRDRKEQRLLFSSLQSLLFNRLLERREKEGTWTTILPGDIAKKHDSGGLFDVPLEGPELEDARARAAAGTISPTGPMFGAKMRWPHGEPAEMERSVLGTSFDAPGRVDAGAAGEVLAKLDAFRNLGEGTRRSLRLSVEKLTVTRLGDDGMVVDFVLPKGGYATTVLGRACHLVDVRTSRNGARQGEESDDAMGSDAVGGPQELE
jgi:tRNA pseudouridine13 synthase